MEFLKQPKRFLEMGIRTPAGVLLVGQPGTGKTLLARAVAAEANVPLINCSGAEFVDEYVGMGAAKIRDLFELAREKVSSNSHDSLKQTRLMTLNLIRCVTSPRRRA